MNHYYKAGPELSAKIISLINDLSEIKRQAREYGKEIGCSDPNGNFYASNEFGRFEVSGYAFDKDPPSGWVRMSRRFAGVYKPGAKCQDRKRFGAFKGSQLLDVMNLINMKPLVGMTVRSPGVDVIGDVAYLTVPEDVTPPDSNRISDIEFENALSRHSHG